MTPKQRGGGSPKFGNTGAGHISNRASSRARGGTPTKGGGGGGKTPRGGCPIAPAAGALFLLGMFIEANALGWFR